jgi:hypothetical protein
MMRVSEIVKANPYWIRDGGDLPREIIYHVSKSVADMARVAEKLPEEYVRHETIQLEEVAKLIRGAGGGTPANEPIHKKEGNGWR